MPKGLKADRAFRQSPFDSEGQRSGRTRCFLSCVAPLAHNCLPAPFGPLCSCPLGLSPLRGDSNVRNILTEKRFQPFGHILPFAPSGGQRSVVGFGPSPLGTERKHLKPFGFQTEKRGRLSPLWGAQQDAIYPQRAESPKGTERKQRVPLPFGDAEEAHSRQYMPKGATLPFGPLRSRVPKGESCFARKGRNI